MLDKLKELFKPAFQVFLIGTIFCCFPIIGIVGIVGLVILSAVKTPKEAVDKGLKLLAGLLITVVWVILAQTLLGWLFGISLDSFLHEYGSLKGLLGGVATRSTDLSKIFIQEILILIVSFGSLYLYLTSRAHKKTIWFTVIVGLLLLSYYWFDNYAKVSKDVSDQQKYAMTQLRNAMNGKITGWINSLAHGLFRENNWRELLDSLPFKRYTTKDKIMKLDSGEDFALRSGSILYFKDEPKSETHDGGVVPWYETTYLDDASGKELHGKVTIENLSSEPPEQPKRIEVAQAPSPVSMEESKVLVVKKEQGWIRTGLVPSGSMPIFYEILSPAKCVASDFLVRIGQYGSTARGEPFNGNEKLLRVWAVDGNSGCYQGELQLSSSAFSEVVVRATIKTR